MKEQGMKVRGRMTAKLRKPDGVVVPYVADNLVVEGGIDFICNALGVTSGRPSILSHIAVGTGVTAVDAEDTELDTELARQAATYAHSAGTTSFTMSATIAAGTATGDLTEAAVINNSTGGIMFNRVVFSPIPKEASDDLDITFTFTFTPT